MWFRKSYKNNQKRKGEKQTSCIASGDEFYFVMPYFLCLALLLRKMEDTDDYICYFFFVGRFWFMVG